MAIYRTTHEGRPYEVEIKPVGPGAPFHRYCEVYRLRKDGSRGLQLQSWHSKAWAVWKTVQDEVLGQERAS